MASSESPVSSLRPLSLSQRPLQLRTLPVTDGTPSPVDASVQRQQKRYSTLSYAPPAITSPLQSPTPGLSRSSSRSGTRSAANRASVDVTASKRPSSLYGTPPVTPAVASGSEDVPNEVSQDSTDARAEAAVMTLAETHADLLRSIAQKEAKCLELRTQLSQQEAELKELKAQWTGIVQKTVPGSSGGGSISLTGAAVIREGMGRLFSNVTAPLASALDALDPTSDAVNPHDTSDTMDGKNRKAGAVKMVRGHTHNSSSRSSASNSSFAASRYSISSASSSSATGRVDPFTSPYFDDGKTAANSSPLSRTGPDYFSGTENTVGEGRSKNSTPTQNDTGDSASPTTWAATIPGIDGLNKKWEEIQRGDTFVKNSRRASTLLSDVSASFISTFAPPLNEPLRPHKPRLVSSRPQSAAPPSSFPTQFSPSNSSAGKSLLDDDDEHDAHTQEPMVPLTPTPLDAAGGSGIKKQSSKATEDDDAWNW